MKIFLTVVLIMLSIGCSKKRQKLPTVLNDSPIVQAGPEDKWPDENTLDFGDVEQKEVEKALKGDDINSTILFALNSSGLSRTASNDVLKVINDLKASGAKTVYLKGGCCPLGAERYNKKLGYDRAVAVGNLIKSMIPTIGVVLTSVGEEDVISQEPELYYLNRRCEVTCD